MNEIDRVEYGLYVAVIIIVAITVGLFMKFEAPRSDYQRLNAIEHRLDVIEHGS